MINNLDKCISQFGQWMRWREALLQFWSKEGVWTSDSKYILGIGKIQLGIWTNTINNLDKCISQFGHWMIWREDLLQFWSKKGVWTSNSTLGSKANKLYQAALYLKHTVQKFYSKVCVGFENHLKGNTSHSTLGSKANIQRCT